MYQLFTEQERIYTGLLGDADLINIKKRTKIDLSAVVDYYRYGTFFTRTDHLLVKLINTVATPLSYDIDRYHEVTSARGLYSANALQLTSSINRGKWHHGVFYHGCDEIILASQSEMLTDEELSDWKNIQAVKVLECPVSNLMYLPPTGAKHQEETGLVTISVDISALMLQYYQFMQAEYRRKAEESGYSLLSVQHFVGKYVLPNMLHSQTERALFNRCYNLQMGLPMGKALRRHPFMVTNQEDRVDKKLAYYLEKIENAKRPFESYLAQIPTFFGENSWQMPDIAETRQVWWALFITRLRDIEFLLDTAGKDGMQSNRQWLAKLKIDIKRFNSDGVFKAVLPETLLFRQQRLFSEWLAL